MIQNLLKMIKKKVDWVRFEKVNNYSSFQSPLLCEKYSHAPYLWTPKVIDSGDK